jgi:hypothetical protein
MTKPFGLNGAEIDGLRNRGLSWLAISGTLEAPVRLICRTHKQWLCEKQVPGGDRAQQDERTVSDSSLPTTSSTPTSNSHLKTLRANSFGRPRRDDIDPVWIDAVRRRGFSWRAIGNFADSGTGTVMRYHKAWLAQLKKKREAHQPEPSRRRNNRPRPIREV